MPACGYEFYLLVFNSISRVEHSKIKFVSTRGHVISSIYQMSKDFVNTPYLLMACTYQK